MKKISTILLSIFIIFTIGCDSSNKKKSDNGKNTQTVNLTGNLRINITSGSFFPFNAAIIKQETIQQGNIRVEIYAGLCDLEPYYITVKYYPDLSKDNFVAEIYAFDDTEQDYVELTGTLHNNSINGTYKGFGAYASGGEKEITNGTFTATYDNSPNGEDDDDDDDDDDFPGTINISGTAQQPSQTLTVSDGSTISGTCSTGKVVIPEDAVITIKGTIIFGTGTIFEIGAGATIKGDSSVLSYIIIDRGAKIEAVGTAVKPITFTSDKPEDSRKRGDWGGIIINGYAPINAGDANGEKEGEANSGMYGGTQLNDNSGTLKYVCVFFCRCDV